MAAKTCAHPQTCDLSTVEVFASLGDQTRLAIVRILAAAGSEVPWRALDLPVAPSTLSHHLKVLREAGIVHSRQEGTRCYVSVRRDDLEQRFPGLLAIAMQGSEISGG